MVGSSIFCAKTEKEEAQNSNSRHTAHVYPVVVKNIRIWPSYDVKRFGQNDEILP